MKPQLHPNQTRLDGGGVQAAMLAEFLDLTAGLIQDAEAEYRERMAQRPPKEQARMEGQV